MQAKNLPACDMPASLLHTCRSSTWRMRSVVICVLALAMATAVLAGQSEVAAPRRWWRNATIQHDLRLTSEQVQQLDSIFERDLPARIAMRQLIAQLDRELLRLIGLEADDAVMRLSEAVERLRAQCNVRRSLMLVAMYKTLTPAQRAKLFAMSHSSASSVH